MNNYLLIVVILYLIIGIVVVTWRARQRADHLAEYRARPFQLGFVAIVLVAAWPLVAYWMRNEAN